MSRPSKLKPAAVKPEAVAPLPVQTPPEAEGTAPAVPAPESTLGDGDATGAAAQTAEVSAAPQAPAPDVAADAVAQKVGPEGWTVRITGPARGRWRAGRKFGAEEVAIPASELTEAEVEMLAGDPELHVTVTEDAA